jgi:hypothetical protein
MPPPRFETRQIGQTFTFDQPEIGPGSAARQEVPPTRQASMKQVRSNVSLAVHYFSMDLKAWKISLRQFRSAIQKEDLRSARTSLAEVQIQLQQHTLDIVKVLNSQIGILDEMLAPSNPVQPDQATANLASTPAKPEAQSTPAKGIVQLQVNAWKEREAQAQRGNPIQRGTPRSGDKAGIKE